MQEGENTVTEEISDADVQEMGVLELERSYTPPYAPPLDEWDRYICGGW